METFNFPYHRVQVKYPNEGTTLKLGGSWSYSSKPSAPPQRSFELSFKALKYYGSAGDLDLTTDAEINLGALEAFYQLHGKHTAFNYPHPTYGDLQAKFAQPLVIPPGKEGGAGIVEGIVLVLVEQPV